MASAPSAPAGSAGNMDKHRQYASGYSLDLYCDKDNVKHSHLEFPHTYVGETFGECAKEARKNGWVIHRKTRTATCPKCNRSK